MCDDSEMSSLKRRLGNISIKGVTSSDELNIIQEEEEEDEETCEDGPVFKVANDDSQLEGFYEGGVPHGYFRIINSFGDLVFFGCFFRGNMLGIPQSFCLSLIYQNSIQVFVGKVYLVEGF